MQQTFVDQSLAARLEDTQAWRAVYYAEASVSLTKTTDGTTITVAGAQVIFGGSGLPVNRAIGLGLHGAITAADLDRVESFYSERGADTIIDLCPLADPSLTQLLQGRGYSLRNWMSMLFLPLPSTPAALNPALHVTRATPDQSDLWLTTSVRGFDETEEPSRTSYKGLAPNFYAKNSICYFAWLGETAIATGGMYLHQGVIELGGASTLVSYRKLGAQTALIHRRLYDAHAVGCDLAVVLTTPGSASQRNMQRRGFQLAYTRAICVRPLLPRP